MEVKEWSNPMLCLQNPFIRCNQIPCRLKMGGRERESKGREVGGMVQMKLPAEGMLQTLNQIVKVDIWTKRMDGWMDDSSCHRQSVLVISRPLLGGQKACGNWRTEPGGISTPFVTR